MARLNSLFMNLLIKYIVRISEEPSFFSRNNVPKPYLLSLSLTILADLS